ncbi:tRNA pseudouridine synthase B [Oryzomicrobium terrae]|uniref:tRNA pseudouridine synthase B n=1 Tax=Oryzomicrobium terrae TaxID=1735038 RepID=A0A5C1E731_9RHOO|nr:tRNA pseudouridine(55) synthase TruB [Oryzomicrobium terrae]QEL64731.1 tRNA pseudouridine synthase B [Oryzomicrobium terrae]
MQKKRWQRVDGVLLLDKPQGLSSNTALQQARRLVSAAKAGHTGTLDPMATGLLPLCFGEATKFSADLLDADKTYEAEVCFGATTDTGDAEGEVREQRPVTVGEADLVALLPRFTGSITQVPPMYSALKRDGKPLYELARQGVEVERQPRAVTIHALELLGVDVDSRGMLTRARLAVTCSKGTYIRVLAEDIGAALGCGAHLTALRRTRVGSLSLADALTLSELESVVETERVGRLAPVDALLSTLPRIDLTAEQQGPISHGNPVRRAAIGDIGKVRIYADNVLLGVGEQGADGWLRPKRLVQAQECGGTS